MKRLQILWLAILSVFMFLAPLNKSTAQDIFAGAKAGLNYSSIALNYFEVYDYRMGNSAGLFAEYQSDDLPFNVGVEVHYMIFGSNNIEPTLIYNLNSPIFNTPIENSHFYFNSFEVPLLIKFKLPFMEGINPQFYLGGMYSYIYSAYNRNIFEDDKSSDAEITERIKANDYGALAGIGGAIDIGDFSITYDARYRMGFRNINNVVNYTEFTAHSLQFMVGMGYSFGFGSGD